jgi:hypothetical protein
MDLAVEYDLDEEDEEWLEQYNTEVGGRGGATACLLVHWLGAAKPLQQQLCSSLLDAAARSGRLSLAGCMLNAPCDPRCCCGLLAAGQAGQEPQGSPHPGGGVDGALN